MRGAVGLLALAALAIAFALQVTPAQSVSTAGQTVGVGAAAPTLSVSGPGVLDLFGQSLPTRVRFEGPVRPRLVLTRISVGDQVEDFLTSPDRANNQREIGSQLADGWHRYFAWELGFVALGALVLAAAFAGLRRQSPRRIAVTLVLAIVVAEAVNLGGVMFTAYSAPAKLGRVRSLSDLVGRRELPPIAAAGAPKPAVEAVVIGDSTAAGLGLRRPEKPTDLDKRCHRSGSAYAFALARVNDWQVENLACSGATIAEGLLGPQPVGSTQAPGQVAALKRAVNARAVFVSIGANDVGWEGELKLCAVSKTCEDAASTAYFQQQLHVFADDYYELLQQLALLPGAPTVVVNEYYSPFDADRHCLDEQGLTDEKEHALLARLDALNAVLRNGADAYGFVSAHPDFSGHGVCSAQPYVQGLDDDAPFHPTASGQLAIALADEHALNQNASTTTAGS